MAIGVGAGLAVFLAFSQVIGKLLYGVQDCPRGTDGAADKKVQAYNFRLA